MRSPSLPPHRRRLARAALAGLTLLGARAYAQSPVSKDAPPPTVVRTGAAPVAAPRIPHTKFQLKNGLTVVVAEDHSAPVASVVVLYDVGSKDEKAGRTGFAHLFEHVMFMGSEHAAAGEHPKILLGAGATINGTTDNDRTLYYDNFPSNVFETGMWLESDRMGFLLPTLDKDKLDKQREVVKNERRQRVDNQPFGLQREAIASALYPAGHGYSWDVIGSMADLGAATLDDVKDFFRTYYAPNNAVLVIGGDVTTARARALAERYFGDIPAGPPIKRSTIATVTLDAEKRLVLEDTKARVPQISFTWPTVGMRHKDVPALTALGRVLTQDRTSRLTKLLVHERQLATNVFAGQNTMEDVGEFIIGVIPRPGASLTEIERLVDSVTAGVRSAPPSAAEVERFKQFQATSAITSLQTVYAKSSELGRGELYFKDPERFRTDLRQLLSVTPADVNRAAKQYLGSGRIVLSMVPAGKLDLVSKPNAPYTNVTPKSSVQ
jgi:zinc protease